MSATTIARPLTEAEEHAWKPAANPWLIAASVMLATFMVVLDSSVANVALPHIAGNLSATTDESTWVLTSYLVSAAIVLPATFTVPLDKAKLAVRTVTLGGSGTRTSTVTIGGAAAGDFAQSNNCGTSVPSGGNCVVSVTFNPTATGLRNGTLTVASDASLSPQSVALTGTGTAPAVSLSTLALGFGNQALNVG